MSGPRKNPGATGASEQKKLPRGVYEKVPGSKDYWIRFADPTGKIRRQHVGKSLAAAKEIVEQRRTEVRLGKFNPDSVGKRRRQKMTIAEMFSHYRKLRHDVRNVGEDLRYGEYWTGLFGEYELDELTTADLEQWRKKRITEVEPATCNRAITYLRAYYNLARRDAECLTNPAERLKPMRENSGRTRFLDYDEQGRLQFQLDSESYLLVEFAIQTGLRQAEQFGLRWEDVDLKTGNLRIIKTKAGGERFVPINTRTRELLEVLKGLAGSSPWVFPTRRNPAAHVAPNNFTKRVFRPALERAGIKDFVWHDLRRTAGSRLAMAGKPLHTIGQILGQATPRVTAIYSRLSPMHLREAMETLCGKATDTTTDT